MIFTESLLEMIPHETKKKIEGKAVIQAGWAAGPAYIARKNYDFDPPVPLSEAASVLEADREIFRGCHILLEDHSVLWFQRDSFLRYDSGDRALRRAGFSVEIGKAHRRKGLHRAKRGRRLHNIPRLRRFRRLHRGRRYRYTVK